MLKKLKSNSGASVVFALCVFLIVTLLSTVMLSGALSAMKNTVSQQEDEQEYLNSISASKVIINQLVSKEIDRHIDCVYITEPYSNTLLSFNNLLPVEYMYSSSDINAFESELAEYNILMNGDSVVYNLGNETEDNVLYNVFRDILANIILDEGAFDYNNFNIDNNICEVTFEFEEEYDGSFMPITFRIQMDEDYTVRVNVNSDKDRNNTSFILYCVPSIQTKNITIPYSYVVYVNKEGEDVEEGSEPELVEEIRESYLIRTINIREFRWYLEGVQKGKDGVF